jgi:hypothetical protein
MAAPPCRIRGSVAELLEHRSKVSDLGSPVADPTQGSSLYFHTAKRSSMVTFRANEDATVSTKKKRLLAVMPTPETSHC